MALSNRHKAAVAASLLSGIVISGPVLAQSADDGRKAFMACAACHGVKPNEKKMGPTLFGVVGRKAASVPGFTYSPAMKNAKISWSKAELDAFLKGPSKKVPGTKMASAGIPDDNRRAALLAYLGTLK